MEIVFGVIILLLFLFVYFRKPRSFRDPTELVASEYEIEGVTMYCRHCKHIIFFPGRAQLNTAIASLFGLDWANKEATYLSCERCGHIHWFKRDYSHIQKWRKGGPVVEDEAS